MNDDKRDYYLSNFVQHCKLYYTSSLSTKNDSAITSSVTAANDKQACQTVLKALEYHTINIHEEQMSSEMIEFISSNKVEQFKSELKNCGLFVEIPGEASSQQQEMTHQLLLQYTKIRDQQRKAAHENQMENRRKCLEQLIREKSSQTILSSDDTGKNHDSVVTSYAYLRKIRGLIRNFLRTYKDHIGTHAFLAGMKKLIEKQSKENNIVTWTLNASTLSEVNFSSSSSTHGEDYMKDAVELLFSFVVPMSLENLTRAEEGKQKEFESLYSFHIHPAISNGHLKTLLTEFGKTDLDARPTGTFDVLKGKKNVLRSNISGDLDEHISFTEWSRLHCDIL